MKPPTGHRYRQKVRRSKIKLVRVAINNSAASSQAVTLGWVSTTALKSARMTKPKFWSQILRNRRGQRRLSPLPVIRLSGPRTVPFCSHSPGIGIGQMLHHPRPKIGTPIRMSAAHQPIHTAMMAKLRLPTTVPIKPVVMANRKPPRAITRRISWGQRLVRRCLTPGREIKSKRIIDERSKYRR